jgi:hypothetical protein
MANVTTPKIIAEIEASFGDMRKLPDSNSMYVLGDDAARIYFRYSRVHGRGQAFFGLRKIDLLQLEGRNSFIALLTDDGSPTVFLPYAAFEGVFQQICPASDGQYKVQLLQSHGTRELYVPKRGKFNVNAFTGIETIKESIEAGRLRERLDLTHCQVQTLLAAIGVIKGYEVFVPASDHCSLDWSLTPHFSLRRELPPAYADIQPILSEIDVLWVANGRSEIEGLFEVEHSTPIYSGLLRFNDVLLTNPKVSRFFVVSNDERRDLFVRQLGRPTFRRSGLAELTSFLEYANVADWHARASKGADRG